MKVKRLVVGPIETNCYIVYDEKTRDGVVIDPGGDAKRIIDFINNENLKIDFILNTHGHFDHIGANLQIKKHTGAKIAIHENEKEMLSNKLKNGSEMFGIPFETHHPDIILQEGMEINFGRFFLKVLFVPGHSSGSVAFLGEDKVFSGDVIFKNGVGRTDLPGGNWQTLLGSIRDKIFSLNEDTIVFPGHGDLTTVKEEKTHNPFINEILS